jgi:hypothetical protein
MTISEMKSKVSSASRRAGELLPPTLRYDAAVADNVAAVAQIAEDGTVSIPDGSFIYLGMVRTVRHASPMCDAYLTLEVGVAYPTLEVRFRFRGGNGMFRETCQEATTDDAIDDVMVSSSVPHMELKLSAPRNIPGLQLRLRNPHENMRLYNLLSDDDKIPEWFRYFVVEGKALPKTTKTGWEARLEERDAQKKALAKMGLL